MKVVERGRRFFAGSPVLGAVVTLMSGTFIAQVITFVLQIFIARIYSDVDKGLLGVYGSITSFVITFAALRYDLAIMLPDNDVVARVLHRLATRSIIIVSMLTSLFCFVMGDWLEANYHHSSSLRMWLICTGVTVFVVAQASNYQYWLTRMGRFRTLAANSVIRSLATAGLQLVAGLVAHGGLSALLSGTLAGQIITLVVIRHNAHDVARPLPDDAPGLVDTARRYKRMPLLNGPNAIVDALRNTGVNLLIGAAAIASLGQFQLAWNILQVPVGLIAGSVGQVFLKKLSDTPRGGMQVLVVSTLRRAALAAFIPFALLFLLAPYIFPL